MWVRVNCSVCVSSYGSGREEWGEGFCGSCLFQVVPHFKEVFLNLGLIFLSDVRSILPTSSTLACLYLTQNWFHIASQLTTHYWAPPKPSTLHAISLLKDFYRAPSWLQDKVKPLTTRRKGSCDLEFECIFSHIFHHATTLHPPLKLILSFGQAELTTSPVPLPCFYTCLFLVLKHPSLPVSLGYTNVFRSASSDTWRFSLSASFNLYLHVFLYRQN